MLKRFVLAAAFFFILLVNPVLASEKNNFLTLIYPVRGTGQWVSPELGPLNRLLIYLDMNQTPATFLLQYDSLGDSKITDKIRSGCPNCELGILLEVSEQLATDALVSYKMGDGNWARPDKVFLSGYSLLERQRLIDRVFDEFRKVFGYTPTSVGAWYVDPYSLNYLRQKYGVTSLVSVADQYDTDAQHFWGKPWGTPYYAQKYDLLSEATSVEDKLDIVQIQWAQRDPTGGYGNGVWYSQNSFQANDYTNNKRNQDFFLKLLNYYLKNDNPFNQVTIGLEVGQELTTFETEHFRQLAILRDIVSSGDLHPATMRDFAAWYERNYPNISPEMKISDGKTTWTNNPCYRVGANTSGIFDFRPYRLNNFSPDLFRADNNHFLSREVVSLSGGQRCYPPQYDSRIINLKIGLEENRGKINDFLGIFRISLIDGKRVIGLQTGPEKLIGFWQDKGFGQYFFPFQTLVRFHTPLSIPNIIR